MTNLLDKYKNQSKCKQFDDEEVSEASIFDILENDFQIGDLVWAKLNGYSWWPAFIYGSFSDNWKHVKLISKPDLPTKKQYFVYCFGAHFKFAWVSQGCLCRYKGLEEFVNYSESQAAQASTKRTEELIRNRFKVQISEELYSLWQESLKEADEISSLPINLRMTTFEKMLRRLLIGTKYKIPQQGQTTISDNISIDPSINEEQQSQIGEKNKRRFSFNSTRNDIDQSSKNQDNDVVIIKINTPMQSTSVSLTTAICHFLDKGIPSLTVYEESRLVNELINHPLNSSLSLTDAQLYLEQYIINTASMNYKHRMLFVQSDFFYDFLLKYPQIILKHRQWFKDFKQTLMPINSESIQLKKWQLATLLHAHINLEQRLH